MTVAIGHYLPADVVRDLTRGNPDPASLDKVVYGTCLATDMAGFSGIAERLSPAQLAHFMNDYFDLLAEALKRHGVSVTEFHADTIMCAWTGSERDRSVREKAVNAAIDVIEAIETFAAREALKSAADGGGTIRLTPRIGLQDGHFYLGHTGGGGRLAYSIVGDPANTASRLESLNKHLKTRLLAAASVVEGLDGLLIRPLGTFRVAGKTEATPVVEVLGRLPGADESAVHLCSSFAEALRLCRLQDWEQAIAAFEAVLERHPEDRPTLLYLERCRRFAGAGPGNEDPTLVAMETK
jgi:adenylate cyclase